MDVASFESELKHYGQEHLLHHFEQLHVDRRKQFFTELGQIDFGLIQKLFKDWQAEKEISTPWHALEAPDIQRLPRLDGDHRAHQLAVARGQGALKSGQIGVVLVAGGQGTRLGHDAPKGTYPIGPVTPRSLFQIHAEKLLSQCRKYKRDIPLLIMCSEENRFDTEQYFQDHKFFGLKQERVHFFTQGMLPAIDASTGKVLLKSPGEIALSPNGHGGIILALNKNGLLDELSDDGITDLFYFQVDNPLVKVADEAFIGYHLAAQAEMSLKVIAKLYPLERMGNLVQIKNRLKIIEYTELPKYLAEETLTDGSLRIWAGSPAIHLFSVSFLKKLGQGNFQLPYHIAHKAVPYVNRQADTVKPTTPNALKFETFVFDALPLAERAVAVETCRSEEFEPLKNVQGENSPQSVRQAMSNLYAAWIESAGGKVVRDSHLQSLPIEISPLLANSADDIKSFWPGGLTLNRAMDFTCENYKSRMATLESH